jgi:5'(3')-deoxyribonucleotidase
MIFLLDVDGVVCNFVDGLIASHGWAITHEQYNSWNHHRLFGLTDEQMWEPTNDGSWWTKLSEYPWAHRLVSELRARGEVIFCTSPSLDSTCPSQKVQWLREHGFMAHDKNDYQIGPRKELNAGSGAILIDDSDSNVKKYIEHGGKAILFPQNWNANASIQGDKVDYVLGQLGAL